MSEPELTLPERELRALHTLEQHVTERVKSESDTERGFRRRREDEERAYQANRQRVTATAAKTRPTRKPSTNRSSTKSTVKPIPKRNPSKPRMPR